MAFIKDVGHGDLSNYVTGYGMLTNGQYFHKADIPDAQGSDLIATADSLMPRVESFSGDTYQIATMIDGTVGPVRNTGDSPHWDMVARTADSLFFYKTDGTAWISTLSGGNYANVGPLPGVSSGWTLIEGAL
ncbi:hypothetical protein [Nocardia seriolae]|uniref:Uncharacterized protein n=1 Tax=Nocardia seriolae TaxID=37332 RepID=A0ABC9YTZ9_9NOCA|nr:hypothetical protein [Nocardia seriolae]APB00678.1 hypothetical protein NS506_06647 [Nocardia seriolae]OJF79073.1 hypothetical protein NS14008_07445 [Nocardia seriolae]PSK31883.1 hypothetical protein C6575_07950 [Nocardia seriolae]QOW30640.1 hypothetical protein IMZ23_20835 [Nocardia seriolae]QUN15432.1 hypothetical protein KEC46_24060 [Nocardia seriolae]